MHSHSCRIVFLSCPTSPCLVFWYFGISPSTPLLWQRQGSVVTVGSRICRSMFCLVFIWCVWFNSPVSDFLTGAPADPQPQASQHLKQTFWKKTKNSCLFGFFFFLFFDWPFARSVPRLCMSGLGWTAHSPAFSSAEQPVTLVMWLYFLTWNSLKSQHFLFYLRSYLLFN